MADGKSCRGCSEKCLRNHFNGHGSSFFKVMAGEFSSFLEVPSGCFKQRRVKGYRDAVLEGPSGHLWHAKLYISDKSACFKEGWEIFVSDHSIQSKDVIVVRHASDAHFLVQIFEPSGYEKKSTGIVKNCESRNFKKLGTETTTFGQTVKGNLLNDASENVISAQTRDASDNVIRAQKRITRSMGLKAGISGNSAIASISSSIPLSTKKHKSFGHSKINVKQKQGLPKSKWKFTESQKHEFLGHSKINVKQEQGLPKSKRNITESKKHEFLGHSNINVKQELGLPKSKWNLIESQVGSFASHPIILDSEEEIGSQASSADSPGQDTDEVSYHSSSEVLQEKVSSLKEDKTADSVKKGKPKFTQVMKKSAVAHSFWLGIPHSFGRCWFPRGNVEVQLLHRRRRWRVLFVGERNSCGLGPGWKYFAVENELKIGDTCIFELEDKVNYILKVRIQR